MLDLMTVSVMTAVVVVVSGVVFIVETLLREYHSVSRIWSLGFLCGILTSAAYLIWAIEPETWWAVAIGNAAFVASAGFMWLGCRQFNGRSIASASIVLAASVVLTAGAVIIEGEDGGDWSGAAVMFIALWVLPGAAAIETMRGELGRIRSAVGLMLVFAGQSLYYLIRTVVLLTAGSESELFQIGFGTVPTSMVTVVLTIVAVVVTSVLRAERAALRGWTSPAQNADEDGVLEAAPFRRLLDDLAVRARSREELLAVVSVRIDDLERVAAAFGMDEARELRSLWREGMRRHAPTQALVGEDGDGGIAVALIADSDVEVQRICRRLRTTLYESVESGGASVVPAIGVGVGTSDALGYEAPLLLDTARASAQAALAGA